MKAFSYQRVHTVEEAAAAVAGRDDARFIAGGTNLLDLMKIQVEAPAHLVDINRVDGLGKVEATPEGGLRIGTLVRNADLAAHADVRRRYPVLARALLAGASGQLRNKATTGGNLLQRTRCYYFYDPSKPCNKREPGSGCSAREGFNRIHAVLGASDACIAVHPSDMAVAMRALDAQVEAVRGDGSRRVIPIADFHRLPGDTPQQDTTLGHDEFITAVTLPPPPPGVQLYRKVRDRASFAFALVSIAAIVDATAGTVRSVRLAFGGLAHKPWRAGDVEQALANVPAKRESFEGAADVLLRDARGWGHNDFKIPLARRVLAGVLGEATAG